MLRCYIALGWKGLPVTNTLGYLAHLKVTKTFFAEYKDIK
jgi:hypothetical protein